MMNVVDVWWMIGNHVLLFLYNPTSVDLIDVYLFRVICLFREFGAWFVCLALELDTDVLGFCKLLP